MIEKPSGQSHVWIVDRQEKIRLDNEPIRSYAFLTQNLKL